MRNQQTHKAQTVSSSRSYLIELGERVRKLRETQGETLKEVAQLSGLSDRFIIDVEKGKANPSLSSIIGLAQALHTSPADLLAKASESHGLESESSVHEILALLENRPREQISRILAAVSAYLKNTKESHIALVGMRGAGKTTVGHLLASSLKAPFYELDELIEKDTGLMLAEIFDLEGESYYRAVEERVLQRVLKKTPGVIAAGGGLVVNPASLFMLKLGSFVVWLKASAETLIARVRSAEDERRLSAHPNVKKQLTAILARRTPFYVQADLVVNTTDQPAEIVARAILDALQNPKPGQGKARREKLR